MRISDWSSDVCSSDLAAGRYRRAGAHFRALRRDTGRQLCPRRPRRTGPDPIAAAGTGRRARPAATAAEPGREVAARRGQLSALDRKSVVQGKSVSVRVDLGGRRIIKKKKNKKTRKQ